MAADGNKRMELPACIDRSRADTTARDSEAKRSWTKAGAEIGASSPRKPSYPEYVNSSDPPDSAAAAAAAALRT